MTDQTIPLTEQQLDDIEARATAATPGPWEEHAEYGQHFYAYLRGPYLRGVGTLNFGDGEDAAADREFVLHARQDVPALLAEIRRLKGQRKYLIGQLAKRDAESGRGDEAVRAFLAGEPTAEQPAAKPLPDGFERQSCVTVKCAVCGYVYDETEYLHHFPTAGDATDGAVGAGWDELKDGRVLCETSDEKHDELRKTVGLVDDSDA